MTDWILPSAQAVETQAEIAVDAPGTYSEEVAESKGLLADTYFWTFVALVLFFALVWKMGGFRAMARGLDSRIDAIRNELDQAENLRIEAQSLLAQYQRQHRDALKDAEALVEQAKVESERLRKQAEADLEAAIERRKQQALVRIGQAEQEAVNAVKRQAVGVAMLSARQVLAEQLREGGDDTLIENAAQGLPNALN